MNHICLKILLELLGKTDDAFCEVDRHSCQHSCPNYHSSTITIKGTMLNKMSGVGIKALRNSLEQVIFTVSRNDSMEKSESNILRVSYQ